MVERERFPQHRFMKTMDCSTLGTLIENHAEMDVIDVRSKKDFAAMHIPGARSLPFTKLAAPNIFRRRNSRVERVYIISDDRAIGSLASGILRSSGSFDPVVIDGGMKSWISLGFPVRRAGGLLELATLLRWAAAILSVAGIVFAVNQNLIPALIVLSIAAILIKAGWVATVRDDKKLRRNRAGSCSAWNGINEANTLPA